MNEIEWNEIDYWCMVQIQQDRLREAGEKKLDLLMEWLNAYGNLEIAIQKEKEK